MDVFSQIFLVVGSIIFLSINYNSKAGTGETKNKKVVKFFNDI